ncbi:hypothetical protein, partial [Escherichia coli]|uniref:hypothetical protein n=1 Tax=Escherichia coli TaxID=562 RepID=UPI0020106D05
VLHEQDEVRLYSKDPAHVEEGIKITVQVRRKLIHGYAMKLAKVANHLCRRKPKSGLQLGSENGNLVTSIHKAKLAKAR